MDWYDVLPDATRLLCHATYGEEWLSGCGHCARFHSPFVVAGESVGRQYRRGPVFCELTGSALQGGVW